MHLRRLALVTLAVIALAAGPSVAAVEDAAPVISTHDYLKTANLSAPTFAIEKVSLQVPMGDQTTLYVEVTRPKTAGRYPVILEASPYHGTIADREGRRILPHPVDKEGIALGLTGYFAPRGYAVVMVDLRGTGRSGGCLDHLGPADASDLKAIVEWAAKQPWSNGRVGMTGHSYVGSTPSIAAAQRPKGLVTIVPSAGLASMYDHQFQAGVPYFLQWAGPMYAYEELAIERDLPGGEHFGTDPTRIGCGLPASSLTTGEPQTSGQFTDWHAARDHRVGAIRSPIPMFLVHGVNDNAARIPAADWFFARRNPADKIWIGQWDHGSGCCPNRRGEQWTAALHAWFDHHLAQRDVDTGPPVEAFLGDADTLAEAITSRTETLVGSQWPLRTLPYELGTDVGVLGADEIHEGSVSFAATSFSGGVAFVSRPLESDLVLAGHPTLRLVASVTTPRVHLIANIYDEDTIGNRRRISQFAINPELRSSLRAPELVMPGQRYVMYPPGFVMAQHVKAGHRLVLTVTTNDPDKVPTFATDPNITVFVGAGGTRLRLPVINDPLLVRDDVFTVDEPPTL